MADYRDIQIVSIARELAERARTARVPAVSRENQADALRLIELLHHPDVRRVAEQLEYGIEETCLSGIDKHRAARIARRILEGEKI